MRIGDVSRSRRFADPVRQRWYAHHRARRFAERMRRGETGCLLAVNARGKTSASA
jgi:hypothetical protein